MDISRRVLLAAGVLTAGLSLFSGYAASAEQKSDALAEKFTEIEARLDARLGAMIVDTESGRVWSHRADERFALNSTFKAFACAGVLARVDAGEKDLEEVITFRKSDLVRYSPVTEKHAGTGMSLGELCGATMTLSDNTAANMVLRSLGGPEGFTAFMRSIGDEETRLDRWETELNEATPGDPRDTTTPAAAAASLRELVLGGVLSENSRRQLEEWMVGNEVGGPLLRAGLPGNWRIGDRTGAGGNGSRGVISVIWPPERKPVVAVVYITQTEASMDERNKAIAEIGGALAQVLDN